LKNFFYVFAILILVKEKKKLFDFILNILIKYLLYFSFGRMEKITKQLPKLFSTVKKSDAKSNPEKHEIKKTLIQIIFDVYSELEGIS